MNDIQNTYWWLNNKDSAHNDVFSFINYLEQNQSYRYSDHLRFMRLYGDYEVSGLSPFNYSRMEPSVNTSHRVTLNIVQSLVDTIASKMSKNKPKPMFLTDGGDWSMRKKAKNLNKFLEGIYYSTEFYTHMQFALKDALINGTGVVKLFTEGSELKAERVFINELKIDDVESYYSKPRQMHQVKFIHKETLKHMFPGNDIIIDQAAETPDPSEMSGTKLLEMVRVVESWKLPSVKGSDDGRHIITINTRTLFDEPYKKSYFPFVVLRWTQKPLGWYGQGVAEQVAGIQLEINKILRTIQVSMHLVSIPKILVEAGSKINTATLNNKIGGIIKYSGTPPSYQALGHIPPELFRHLDWLYNRAFERVGVSQLAAQSLKPAGLDSGKALREFNNIESERFIEFGQRYEQAFMSASEIMIDLVKDIYAETGSFKVKIKGKKFLDTIDWSEVDMDEDKYVMQVFPTSALSSTPAARFQEVLEMIQAGFIAKEDAIRLLDFPDLSSVVSLESAAADNIDSMIERIVDDEDYVQPEPFENLQLGILKFTQAYNKYKSEGAPDTVLEMLVMWIDDARSLLKQQELEAQGAMTPQMMGAPIVAPGVSAPELGLQQALPQQGQALSSETLPSGI